jgi:hypothetical protein
LDPCAKARCPEVAIEKLKTRETREFLIGELDLQISIDSAVDFAIS